MFKQGMFFGAAIAAAGVAGSASATTLVVEDFTYSDGDLTTVSGGTWGAHSGAGSSPVQVTSGAAVFSHGGGSREDASIGFSLKKVGVLTAAFDLVVNDDDGISGTDFEYFAHFFLGGDFNFRSRVDVVAPNGSGDYSLGIATSDSTAEATLTTDFDFGETVAVEITFNFDTGLSSLTVGSETVGTSEVELDELLNRFALRASNSSSDETITVDNVVISHVVPEPASLALLGLGGLCLLGSLRRKA